MKLIPITAIRPFRIVAWAKVDDADYDRLVLWRWHLDKDGYAQRGFRDASGVNHSIRMHRQVLGLQVGESDLVGDHINRNRLDNRRANLRVLTREQSAQHRGARRRSRSRFRGVNFVPTTGRWIARVRLGSKLHNLGTYDSEEHAARVAAEFRREHMPYAVEELAA